MVHIVQSVHVYAIAQLVRFVCLFGLHLLCSAFICGAMP